HSHLALVTSHDAGLAAHLERADQAGAVHDRDVGVVALILSAASDVEHGAVGVVGVHRQLLAIVPRDDPLLGEDADLGHDRSGGFAEGSAGSDPAADQLVLVGVLFHAFAAGVSDAAGRLLQEQAVLGGGREQTAAASVLYQRLVIELGHKAEERQGEAV